MHLAVLPYFFCSKRSTLIGGLWHHCPVDVVVALILDFFFTIVLLISCKCVFFPGLPVLCLVVSRSLVSFFFKTFQIVVSSLPKCLCNMNQISWSILISFPSFLYFTMACSWTSLLSLWWFILLTTNCSNGTRLSDKKHLRVTIFQYYCSTE